MDDAIGQILDRLDALDLAKETVVYFISDHGAHVDLGPNGGSNGIFKGITAEKRDFQKYRLGRITIYIFFKSHRKFSVCFI